MGRAKKYKPCNQDCDNCPYDDCYCDPELLKTDNEVMNSLFAISGEKTRRNREYQRKYRGKLNKRSDEI